MLHALIADAQARLNEAQRQLRLAALNYEISDEQVLELRAGARAVQEELRALDKKLLSRNPLRFLKFW